MSKTFPKKDYFLPSKKIKEVLYRVIRMSKALGGSMPITAKAIIMIKMTVNGTRPVKLMPLKLVYLRLDTINKPHNSVTTATATDAAKGN